MKALQAKENIYWVGALDPDLRVFDIIMYTEYGTTYNSYLVTGSEKTVLFETVKAKYFERHLEEISSVCDPAKIDYIVVDHTEPDHAGSVAKMLSIAKDATVLGSATAINFLKEIVNAPFRHRIVTEKDEIDIGGMTLKFFSVPMLHWPDSMYTYIPEAKALFTCDSFGCHYSSEKVFNDLIEGDFIDAYKYYFDNIIGPYKNPHMLKALDKIEPLEIEFIGNGHGPVLRTDIKRYFNLYRAWSTPAPQGEKKIAICYVSAYGYTASLAERIREGIKNAGISRIEMFDLVEGNIESAKAAVAASDGFLLGSPTLVGDALPPVHEMLVGLNPVIHRGKYAGAFGSYAWSGEGVPNLMERMASLKLSLPLEGFRVKLKPSEEQLEAAFRFGKSFAAAVLGGEEMISAPKPAKAAQAVKETTSAVGKTKRWRCAVCNQVFEGENPPAVCPICGATSEQFEEVLEEETTFTSQAKEDFVIIGGGIAAKEAATAIRQRNQNANITIISAEEVAPYNRPGLSDYVAGEITEESLPLEPQSWYREHNIRLLLSTWAHKIDTVSKTVQTGSGERIPYTKLLLATGANPFIPCKEIAKDARTTTLRTIADARGLIGELKEGERVVIVGGGILGIEAAIAVRQKRAQLSIVEFGSRLMANQLDEHTSAMLEAKLLGEGIDIQTGAAVTRVERGRVILSTGKTMEADLVIFSAGVRSETALAALAGAKIGRGVLVNSMMETSVEGIYAAGDCAELNGRVPALWSVASEQGAVAGANMAGDSVAVKSGAPSVTFEGFGLKLFSAGTVCEGEGRCILVKELASEGVYKKLVLENGRTVGGILCGDISGGLKLLRAVNDRANISAALEIMN